MIILSHADQWTWLGTSNFMSEETARRNIEITKSTAIMLGSPIQIQKTSERKGYSVSTLSVEEGNKVNKLYHLLCKMNALNRPDLHSHNNVQILVNGIVWQRFGANMCGLEPIELEQTKEMLLSSGVVSHTPILLKTVMIGSRPGGYEIYIAEGYSHNTFLKAWTTLQFIENQNKSKGSH